MAHRYRELPDPMAAFWQEDLRSKQNFAKSVIIVGACSLVCAVLTLWVCLI
jgi:hypothetical protein